jgi:valyl-tRNA synthetase
VTYQTAVAQADLEDRQVRGAWHRIAFGRASGDADSDPVIVATTRPELLPACVALVVHPADERYAQLTGGTVTTPPFGLPVPVLAHRRCSAPHGTTCRRPAGCSGWSCGLDQGLATRCCSEGSAR